MVIEPKSRPLRSQSTRSSWETVNHGGAKGCRKVETHMTKLMENKPGAVPERDICDGEIVVRWIWVEPTVWTLRMLMALESGVKGGKWFSLIDKVHRVRTLNVAFFQVAENKGAAEVDHVTVDGFKLRLDENLKKLSEDLHNGEYHPQ